MPGQAHHRVRCNGTFLTPTGPVEIFSYGFAITGADFLTPAQDQAIAAAVVAFHGRAESRVANACILTEVAISRASDLHRQVGETSRVQVNQGGGGGPIQHPTQVALRVSLGSGLRGRSQRGGFYLPGIALPVVAATMLAADADVQGVADSVLTLIADLRAAVPGGAGNPTPGAMIVASQRAGNVPVQRVRVGRGFDTIRSRRNALTEAYVERAVPA